jgi:putative inorganic carbon (HCO3(-)) transporter
MRRAIARVWVPVLAAVGVGAGLAAHNPALAAVGLLPLVAVALARPERATVLFVFGFYINAPVLAAHDLHLPAASAAAFALMLAVPVMLAVVVGREALVVTPALALMVAYLVVLVFSSIVAGGSAGNGPYAIKGFLTEGLLLFVLVVNAARTPELLRAVIWGLLGAGAVMGAISIFQEATHSYHQPLLGLAQVNESGFKVGETLNGKVLRPRLAGPIGEQNRYAQVLLVLIPLAVSRMRVERDPRLRVLAGGLAALILSGMLLTFSRGAAVALVLAGGAMVATGFVALRHVALFAVAALALILMIAPDYVVRLQSLRSADTATAQDGTADAAIRGRATENLAALATFRDHPIVGVGPGGFFRRYSQEEANKLDLRFGKNRRAHNMYLEIAADTGIVGLVAFLAIVAVTIVQLERVARWWRAAGREDLAALGQAFSMALVGYMAAAIFLQLSYQRYFWFLLALANATAWSLRREAERTLPAPAAMDTGLADEEAVVGPPPLARV